ncbi:MAG: hypothetical protein IT184_15880 [Acidobacteria bacterium]|nr:hypothetical protein [Acidobacteriota bacterium]
MAHDPDDDLATLRTALEVDPSPAFTAGVWRRIETDRPRAWRPLVFTAVGALALAAVAIIARRDAAEWDRIAPAPAVTARDAASAADVPRGVEAQPLAAPRSPSQVPASAPASASMPRRSAARSRSEPEVLISHAEARAFVRLVAAVRERRVVVPADDDPVRQAVVTAIGGPQPVPIVRVVVPFAIEPYPDLEN